MAGLTEREAAERLRRGLGNAQVDNSAKTVKDIVRENVFTYFNLIFAILTVLLIVAQYYKGLTFLPVIVANTLIGIFQEINAKNVLDKLSLLNQRTSQVVRNGQEREIATSKLVLGDVIVLRAGMQIPADARVVAGEINVNEALLTGEADEIVKNHGTELMSGSTVVSGEALAELTHVGSDSYISKLMLKARQKPKAEQSELIRSINAIVKFAGIMLIPFGITLFVLSYVFQHQDYAQAISSMVAAVIGMIPEGLYLLVSITLAISATRLAQDHVMLHDMKSIETLARVDVLCVDKTGTITDNSMLVVQEYPAIEMSREEQYQYDELIAEYAAAQPDDNETMHAMNRFYVPQYHRSTESILPFSSRYKYSAAQFNDGTYLLGAPEIVLKSTYELYREQVNEFARKGLRVLVFAQYFGSQNPEEESEDLVKSLPVPMEGIGDAYVSPIMFILLQNPLRENAEKTFSFFKMQGVRIKVISGDNPVTVAEVARTAGIPHSDRYVDATTLTTDARLRNAVRKYSVFGRVTPEQKQKIVRALKKDGHTVAMTGDGVNDILAMKDADCAVAMAAGSDAAVQASQVVLLDSDFSHMPMIVAEGRKVIGNIERSATLFLVKNIFSLLLSMFSIFAVLNYPLKPSQISLISAFNIGIPAFFLAMEPNRKRISGQFLQRVIGKAMPAALTDFLAIAALVVFGQTFGVSEEDVSVAATMLLAIVGFMILIRISSPLNKYRIGVIIGCAVGLILTILVMHDLFEIQHISRECAMLFALFAIATEPALRYLTRLSQFIGRKFERKEK